MIATNDDDNCFCRMVDQQKVFMPYSQPESLPEILTITNLWHAMSRVWTCTESEFRLCWMKLWSSDNRRLRLQKCKQHGESRGKEQYKLSSERQSFGTNVNGKGNWNQIFGGKLLGTSQETEEVEIVVFFPFDLYMFFCKRPSLVPTSISFLF